MRRTYRLSGTIQGVGFRPAVYRLACEAGLGGSVQNRAGAVQLVLEGAPRAITALLDGLPAALPPHAVIEAIVLVDETLLPAGVAPRPFAVSASAGAEAATVTIPADLAMCADCRTEILDATDRRYGYAFTTCTNCGPRYTVVNGMPYDRERTTLAPFPLCQACQAEYTDPRNRRFHAESTACPDCGPRVVLTTGDGKPLPGPPIQETRRRLASGAIVAVRGLGGFLLAVDAGHTDALARLRARKHRPAKPFALMARDLDAVRRICRVPDAAERLLSSTQAPIVVLTLRADVTLPFAHALIAPDTATIGVMLPTTPLHLLLAQGLRDDPTPPFDFLVMTSGNRHAEPICICNDEAYERLAGIADCFLVHDREINLRNDDSLVALQPDGPQVWRRARGYAPTAVPLHRPLARHVLAMGAELKGAIALGYEMRVVLAPHIGDLETPEAVAAHARAARELPRFLDRRPECVAVDLHPDMHATRDGRSFAATAGLPVVAVQHHTAHAAGCLAEHGCDTGLALCFDGTGFGPDGHIWGAELLAVTMPDVRRLGTFAPVPLPGGDGAVRNPIRQVVARWHTAGIAPDPALLKRYGVTDEAYAVWCTQCERRLNAPLTHAAGRLFDTFAALLSIAPTTQTYEGQAPVRLETAARRAQRDTALPASWVLRETDGFATLDWTPVIAALTGRGAMTDDKRDEAALACHLAIVDAACGMVAFGAQVSGLRTVALTGGVFMNRLLCERLVPRLRAMGFTVLCHRHVPPNDGGIAFGQAVVAGLQPTC